MNLILKIIVVLILIWSGIMTLYAISISIRDAVKKRRNRMTGNLHITVDKRWQDRFKN